MASYSVGKDPRRGWYYRLSITVGGKRSQPSQYGFGRKRDARRAAERRLWQLGEAAAPDDLTVGEHVAGWIDARRHTYKPSTLESYDSKLAGHLVGHALARQPLGALTPRHLETWLDELRAHGLAESTVLSCWRMLAASLRQVCPQVLAATIKPRKDHRRRFDVWTPAQVRLVLAHLEGKSLHDPVAVAVHTGLRIGELTGLTWADYTGDALLITQQLTWTGNTPHLVDTKTERWRRVELYPETIALLDARRGALQRRAAIDPSWNHGDRIFPRPSDGGWWHRKNLSTEFQRQLVYVAPFGVPRIPWHGLRHVHVSHLLAAGGDLPSIAARLGHTVETCQANYAHLVQGQQTELVRRGAAYATPPCDRAPVVPLRQGLLP